MCEIALVDWSDPQDAYAARGLFFKLVQAFEKRQRGGAGRKVIVYVSLSRNATDSISIEDDEDEAGAAPKRIVIELDSDDESSHVAVAPRPGEIITCVAFLEALMMRPGSTTATTRRPHRCRVA